MGRLLRACVTLTTVYDAGRRGNRVPQTIMLQRLAQALGVPVMRLLE